MSETSDSRYTSVAIWLHWLIAVFIIMNLVMGLFLDDIKGPERYYFMTIHVSAGLSVLVLTVVRVFWRLLNAPPPYPDDMPAIEKATAHVAHFLLYAAMVIVPLTGWIMGSANPPAGSEGYRYAKYVRMIQQETGQQIKPVSEEIIVVPEDFTVPKSTGSNYGLLPRCQMLNWFVKLARKSLGLKHKKSFMTNLKPGMKYPVISLSDYSCYIFLQP